MINVNKTAIILLQSKIASHPIEEVAVQVGGLSLRSQASFTWLGVTFDLKLSMEDFVNKTCKTCYYILRMLKRIRPSLTTQSTTMLCNSLVCSRIDYCSSLLNNCSKKVKDKLQRVLNLAARIATNSTRFDHVSPLLTQLKWLPVEKRINLKIAIIIYKTLHQLAPTGISKDIIIYVPRRSLRSSESSAILLELGTSSKRIGHGALNVIGPKVWNSLPDDARDPNLSLCSFLLKLKNFL